MTQRILLLLGLLFVCLVACAPEPTATPTLRPAPSTTPPVLSPTATGARPVTSNLKPATLTPGPSSGVNGKFAFSPGDGSLWVQEAESGRAQVLVAASPSAFADSPAFSPDGRRLAYTLSTLSAQGVAQNSIHVIEIEGKNDRVAARPNDIKTAFNWPAFSPDGNWLYYTASYPVPPNQEHSEIQRVPAQGGTAETVVQDARSAVLSGDGKQMAFIRFDFQAFTAALWIADANGKNPSRVIPGDLFAMIAAAHFSPDGRRILFSASGPPAHSVPGMASCEPLLLCKFALPAYADGLPWDLWLVSSDGTHYEQLTKLGMDSPYPAWSRDGNSVAFFDASGIYLVDVKSHKVFHVSKNGGHGEFDWWSAPP